ncbi:hypothetical protein [Staphylococcus saprophyticus]|uniref:hypothetical protein n=1 Tax=Staphylococcus saprophyticus TaxID=29385 RepID=UPI0034C6703F
MTIQEFFKQGYKLIENAPTETLTEIDFEKADLEGVETIEYAIGTEGVKMNWIETVYVDQNPTFDVSKDSEIIKHDLSFKELNEFIASK